MAKEKPESERGADTTDDHSLHVAADAYTLDTVAIIKASGGRGAVGSPHRARAVGEDGRLVVVNQPTFTII